MQTFDITAPVSVVLDVPAGRIQVIAGDRTDAAVEVRPVNASKGRAVGRLGDIAFEGAHRQRGPGPHRASGGPSGPLSATCGPAVRPGRCGRPWS